MGCTSRKATHLVPARDSCQASRAASAARPPGLAPGTTAAEQGSLRPQCDPLYRVGHNRTHLLGVSETKQIHVSLLDYCLGCRRCSLHVSSDEGWSRGRGDGDDDAVGLGTRGSLRSLLSGVGTSDKTEQPGEECGGS